MTCRVTIEGIAAGGDGVGHLEDGLVVFVPRSAPGDTVDIEITDRKQRYARGRVSTLLSAGPGRVEPRCPHYGADDCGGCQLQHVSDEGQLEVKRKIVKDALSRIGKLNVSEPEIVGSPRQWRYRGKVTLASKAGSLGFHRFDRPGSVFDLNDCLIARDRVMELWNRVRSSRGLLPAGLRSLVLRLDRTDGMHVLAVGGTDAWDAAAIAAEVGIDEASYWWKPGGGAARVVAGPKTGYPAVAFEQINLEMADTIRQTAVESLGSLHGKVAWDLYGGVGDTAEQLASRGAKVWSVDSDRSAVEWGSAWGERLGSAVTRVVDRVEEAVVRLPEPDVIVVNPPRAGMESSLARWLQNWSDRATEARLAYVSCDPATLARDLSRMPSFEIVNLWAYDMFPQTGHVETLTVLEAA